ncbi:MAG TPA: TraB/GumN family protein [Polyangia bacterium]
MRAAIAALILLVAGAAAAQKPPPPAPKPWTKLFLWRIDGARPSYLLGTMHLPDMRATHLPQPIVDALAATDGVALELRMDLFSQLEMGLRMQAPKGSKVSDVVPPPLRARLRKIVETHGGSWAMVANVRPWMAGLLLSFLSVPTSAGTPIDVALHDWAIDHGKPCDGLETIAEQSTMGDALPLADQLAILKDAVESYEKGEASPEPLVEAYYAGDERRSLALLHERPGSAVVERFQKMLLDARNVRLVERIRARLAAGAPPTFYAVGLGHVIGAGGIVERLRKAGYKLTRL